MLPQAPFILLSFVNTALRDRFDSLEDFCEDYRAEQVERVKKLEEAGFHY